MAVFGASVIGLNPTLQDSLNRMAARATVGWGFQPDQNMVLMQAIGSIPAVEGQCDVIKEWLMCWHTLGARNRGEVALAWEVHKATLVDQDSRWKSVTCPITAVIATVLDADLEPEGPTQWSSVDKLNILSQNQGAADFVASGIRAFRKAAENKPWQKSGGSFAGGGFEQGQPCDEAVKQAQRFLKGQGTDAEAHVLKKVMCGGVWLGCRSELNKNLQKMWQGGGGCRTQVLNVHQKCTERRV